MTPTRSINSGEVSTPKKRDSLDGNYGWVVVAAAAVGFSLITGLGRVVGLIYVIIIDYYGVTRTKASTIFMTFRLISTCSSPVVSKLLTKFTHSTLICSGGFVLFVALFASAFTTSIWQLVITYGVMIGVAAQLIINPGILAISLHFKKCRHRALSVYFTIAGISGLLIPLIYEILLEKYRLHGAFIIYSALTLNICCCGLLVITPKQAKTRQNDEVPPINDKSIYKKIVSIVKNDLCLFKNPTFIVLLTCRVLIMMPLLNVLQFLPDFVEKDLNLDLSKRSIAHLLAVVAIGDTFARILPGIVLKKLPWRIKHTYAVVSASVGVLLFALLMVRSYAVLLALHVIFGLQLGLLNVTQYILEADLMSPEEFQLSLGINQAAGGLTSVVMMLVVGFIRDVSGSYYIAFSLMGVSAILSGLFWLVEPCLVRCLPPRVEKNANLDGE